MSLVEIFEPIYKNKALQDRGLEDKAVSIYTKFIEQRDKYLSLSASRKNLRSITSQEAFICVAELEKMGYLIGKIDKCRLVYKFNDGMERTDISVPLSKIDAAQKHFEDKIAKKIDKARRVLEKYEDRKNLLSPLRAEKEEIEQVLTKSALELHQDKECDPSTCNFCGFGIEV